MSESNQNDTDLTLSEYQEATKQTAIYPEERGLSYCALGLNGESGEVAERIKKSIRDDADLDIQHELGDVLWYLARLCDECETDLGTVAEQNLEKLLDRKRRDKLHGSGDNR